MTKATYGEEGYPKQLGDFQEQVNPKPSESERKIMKQVYLDSQKTGGNDNDKTKFYE